MNLNRRRPASAKVRIFNKPSKASVVSALDSVGASLEVVKVDKGEWNERREFRIRFEDGSVSELIESAMKGEPVNWAELEKEALKIPGAKL